MIRLENKDIDQAVKVLVRAFWNDLFMLYLAPDETQREKIATSFFKFMLRYVVLYGQAYATSSELEGVALWLLSQYAKIDLELAVKAGFNDLRSELGDDFVKRLSLIDDLVDARHEYHISIAHWYLAYIGIDPKYQGSGFASKLIKPMLEKFTSENLPCYLETNTDKNVSLYEHYGFKLLEEFFIPQAGIKFYAMLRK